MYLRVSHLGVAKSLYVERADYYWGLNHVPGVGAENKIGIRSEV